MSNSEKIRQSTKQFYNDVSAKFSQTRSHFWPGFDFIRKYYKGKGKGKVLDFGCGNGRLVEFLETFAERSDREASRSDRYKQLRRNYSGVDISEKLVEIARKKYPDYDFQVVRDETKLPFGDSQFDFVFSIAVFHHFNPKMAEASLAELERILKPGGIMILSVWYLWKWKYIKYLFKYVPKYLLPFQADLPFKNNEGKTHLRYCYFWTAVKLKRLAKSQGFDILESGFTFDKKSRKRNIYLVLRKEASSKQVLNI